MVARKKLAKAGGKRTNVFCWKCLAPIDPRRQFRLDYVFLPAITFERPLSTFGFCAQCAPKRGVQFFLGERIETTSEGVLYKGISPSNCRTSIKVLWTRAQPSSAPRDLKRLRNQLLSENPKCPCGAPATHVHHAIPRYWFRLNRIPENASYFLENLLPACSACNGRLYNYSVFAFDSPKYWADHDRARMVFEAKLCEALRVASARGMKLYRPPEIDFHKVPGAPVLTRPDRPNDSSFKIAAFIEVCWFFRTHNSNMGPPGMPWRGTLGGQGNPYMVLIS